MMCLKQWPNLKMPWCFRIVLHKTHDELKSVPTYYISIRRNGDWALWETLEAHNCCGLRQRRLSKRSKVPGVEWTNGLPTGQGHWIEQMMYHIGFNLYVYSVYMYVYIYIFMYVYTLYIVCLSNRISGSSKLVIHEYMFCLLQRDLQRTCKFGHMICVESRLQQLDANRIFHFFGGTTIHSIFGFPTCWSWSSGSFQPSLRAEVAGALLILRTEAGELAMPAREVLLECRSVPLEQRRCGLEFEVKKTIQLPNTHMTYEPTMTHNDTGRFELQLISCMPFSMCSNSWCQLTKPLTL